MFRIAAFCVVFVPIVPYAICLVESAEYRSVQFFGRLDTRDFLRFFGWPGLWSLVVSYLLASVGYLVLTIGIIYVIRGVSGNW